MNHGDAAKFSIRIKCKQFFAWIYMKLPNVDFWLGGGDGRDCGGRSTVDAAPLTCLDQVVTASKDSIAQESGHQSAVSQSIWLHKGEVAPS